MIKSKGLIYSITFHLGVFLLLTINVLFFPKPLIDLSQAVRVDMVDLPDKTNNLPEKVTDILKETPTPEPEKINKEEQTKEDKPKPIKEPLPKKNSEPEVIQIEKTKSKQKQAIEKLKKLSAIEKIKESVEKEKQITPIKGRVLSAGTIPKGVDKLQSDTYLLQLDAHIKKNWALPEWLIGKNLKARVAVQFNEAGKIISKKVMASSGNPTYDEYCLKAIERAEPFPKPPEKFVDIYKIDGVQFGFPE